MLKLITLSVAVLSLATTFAQLPFEKDKKWGISRDGTGDKEDSIIVRADYEEIMTMKVVEGKLYAGIRNDEWQFLTANRLVNQQRYDQVGLIPLRDDLAFGYREGYMVVLDIKAEEFLIRGVKADVFSSLLAGTGAEEKYLITQVGKDKFGIVSIALKKEIIKAEFDEFIYVGNLDELEFIGLKEEENHVFDSTGTEQFVVNTQNKITHIKPSDKMDDVYRLEHEGKKGVYVGAYDPVKKHFVPPIYAELKPLDNTSDAIVVVNDKGNKGIYFLGKQLLECDYIEITISDKKGYVAIVSDKKGSKYMTPEGKLVTP